MAKTETPLTARKLKAIERLLEEPTVAQAARRANVPRRTLENWLRSDTAFQRALRQARQSAFGHALARLAKASNKAVSILIDAMDGKEISHLQRLAARDILTFAAQSHGEDVLKAVDEIKAEIERLGW